MHEFICDLRFRHLKVWREANFSCPRAVNKKAVTYHKWCGSSESGPRGSPFSIPSYLYKDLDKHVLRNFSRFRLRAHHLRVESCKWHGGSSICDKCECEEIQDEKHVLFFCNCAEVCELRMRYRYLFEECLRLCVYLLLRALNFFLSYHHSITDFEMVQCTPESRLIQTPQVCVRFSFNFRHWLILFHQPIAISQRLGL